MMIRRLFAAVFLAAAVLTAGCAGQGGTADLPAEESAGSTAQGGAGEEGAAGEAAEMTEAADEADPTGTAVTEGEDIEDTEDIPAEETQAEDALTEDNLTEEAEPEETDLITFESSDGWFVRYDANLIAVTEGDSDVTFEYIGESSGENRITVSYLGQEMPDEALYNVMAVDDVLPEHVRSEGYFAGRSDVWSLRAALTNANGEATGREYIAVEHNDGTLIVDILSEPEEDEAVGMKISDVLAGVLDSFTFTDHQPQTMYAYVSGRYEEILPEEEAEDAAAADAEAAEPGENAGSGEADESKVGFVELGEDHTGLISLQDEIPIIWYCREGVILNADSGEQIYEYNIEDDFLYLRDIISDVTFEFERVSE